MQLYGVHFNNFTGADAARKRQLNQGIEIAFCAKMMNNIDHLGQGQIMVFDDVMTNIDNTMSVGSYNNSSGIFTAPSTDLIFLMFVNYLIEILF